MVQALRPGGWLMLEEFDVLSAHLGYGVGSGLDDPQDE